MPTMEEWRRATTFWPPERVPEQLEPLVRHAAHPPLRIDVGPGWFDLVVTCHQRLVAVFPGYDRGDQAEAGSARVPGIAATMARAWHLGGR